MMTMTAAEDAARTATLTTLIAEIPLDADAALVVRDGFDALAEERPEAFYGAIDQGTDLDYIGASSSADVLRALQVVALHFGRPELAEAAV